MGAVRLHAGHPRRAGGRAGRPQRRGQDHAAASRRRPAAADHGHDRGARRPAAGQPGAARPRRVRGPGLADLQRADRRRSPAFGCPPEPGLGCRDGQRPDRPCGPGPTPAGGQAVRRPARPAGADPRPRQEARAAAPRRAGGQPRPAGPARVPAGPDGGGGRPGAQCGAVLAPGRRPGTGLRLPDRARRLAGADRRRGRAPAGHPPPAHRAPPRPGPPPGRPARDLRQPHRPADHADRAHRGTHPRPGLGRLAGRPRGSGPRLHEPHGRRGPAELEVQR